jgi:hypothetical protein
MADKLILVKTPLTSDGTMPLIGNDGRQVYSESILRDQAGPQGARAIIEKHNTKLQTPLKAIIEDYTGPVGVVPQGETPQPITVQPTTKPKANATA